LIVAPTIWKNPVPGLNWQAMFDRVPPGWGISKTSKMGPQAIGRVTHMPSSTTMPCSPLKAELKLKPVPPPGMVCLQTVTEQGPGVRLGVAVGVAVRVAVREGVGMGVEVAVLTAVAVIVGVAVRVDVGVRVRVGVGARMFVKMHCMNVPGSRAKITWLSPGWNAFVGLIVAPTIWKNPVPELNWQAMFDRVAPGWGISKTSKMGPQAIGRVTHMPSSTTMPCSPLKAELKLKPVPPPGMVFLQTVTEHGPGVRLGVAVDVAVRVAVREGVGVGVGQLHSRTSRST